MYSDVGYTEVPNETLADVTVVMAMLEPRKGVVNVLGTLGEVTKDTQ
jgi:hypothetical protein